jgi:hypothetical protein
MSQVTPLPTHKQFPGVLSGPLKSTGHQNSEKGPEEVEEDPMATARAQENQRHK